MKYCLVVFAFYFLISCKSSKEEADLIIYNTKIYTVDSSFSIQEAMCIKDGKIIAIGKNADILNRYNSNQKLSLEGKFVYPGFIDAHCHFYGYGKGLMQVDLVNTTSFDEVISKTRDFYKNNLSNIEIDKSTSIGKNQTWLIGRGWDQNDWADKEFPNKKKLDSLFPNIPVFLKRVDGHAALVNQIALDLAGINIKTKIDGGEIISENGQLTGVLVDNAVDSVEKLIPELNQELIIKSLKEAEKKCLAFGLTTLDDAGLSKTVIDIIDSLHHRNELQIKVYAMLTPDEINLNYYLKHGPYKTEKLNVRSFKYYADGALGSRGACLCEEYHDKKGWKGFLLNQPNYFEKFAEEMFNKGFQMNTHCIGDSATSLILKLYNNYTSKSKDLRWRIEHAQVVKPDDFKLFSKNCLPSVQTTHATSDMYWAAERLGNERVKYAYAYNDLLQKSGMLALGTDFPVEDINPFKTFYAAVYRKDTKNYPEGGFQMENAITREQALKGMTIWAAFTNFEEKEKGSLEIGKYADLIVLDKDLLNCQEQDILKTKVLMTFINGCNTLN